MIRKYHASISLKWFDFWIGFFWDAPAKALYICLIPMLPIKIWATDHEKCPDCGNAMQKTAYLDDGWLLEWECKECGYYTEDGFPWPFGDEIKSGNDLERLGFEMLKIEAA